MKKDSHKKHGIFIGLLFVLCNKIAMVFQSGIIYRFLSRQRDDEEIFARSGICCGVRCLLRKLRKPTEIIKKFISGQFERSFMLKLFSAALKAFVNIPGRVFGAFGLTWGAYVILIDLIKRFGIYQGEVSGKDLAVGMIAFIASFPFLFTDKSLCLMASESWLVSCFFDKVFGVPDEAFKQSGFKKSGQSIAVILGILLGLLTYFVSPVDMLFCFAAFSTVVLFLSYPEGGVLISIAISPLLGLFEHASIILAGFVLLTALAYFIKVLRGKRVFKLGVPGVAVFAFMLVIFLSGFAPGTSNTMQNALLCCSLMLIFPLVVNLMTYRHWINACIVAFVLPCSLVAFIGFTQYLFGLSPSGWVDESLFFAIDQRAVSVFNNPNILGTYLSAVFPVCLMLTTSRFDRKVRVIGLITTVYVIASTLFTFSRSAWLALLVGGLLFSVMISFKGILWLIPTGGAMALLAFLFPETIGSRLINFVSLTDSANNYRIAVWNSSWDLLSDSCLFGIGWGEEAFRIAYINYGSQGTQYAMHSHSLYMQIAIQTGIIGLLVFAVCILSIVRKCFFYTSRKTTDKGLSLNAKAAMSGAIAVMVAGIFDYTWYNFRVFFLFWALLAFACASVNINRQDDDLWYVLNDDRYSFVTVPIPSDRSNH